MLVDAMCGLTLITIAAMAVVQTQVSSLSVTSTSRETAIAASDLGAAMESILGRPIDEIPVAGSDFAADQPIVRFAGLHLPDQQLVATYPGYTPGGPVPNPLVVVLTATWTGAQGRARRITVRSAKTR